MTRFVLSAACGATVVSLLMNVWTLAGWRWNVPLLIATSISVCAGLRLLIPRNDRTFPTAPAPRTAADRWAIALLFLSVVAALAATLAAAASSPDLLFFWAAKAQAFAEARAIDASFLGAPNHEYMNISYPPLVPNLSALASILAGRFAWGAATLCFPLLLALLAVGLTPLLRLTVPEPFARATAALAVSVAACLGIGLGIAGNGDMPLVFFETLAAAMLIGPWPLEAGGQLITGLLLAGAVSTKAEGFPFALSAGVLFLFLRRREVRALGAGLRLLLPSAACLAAWFAFGTSRGLFVSYHGFGRTFDLHWERLPLVLLAIGKALWSADWALPFAIPLIVLLTVRRHVRANLVLLGPVVLLAGFYVFTYLHGNEDPSLWIFWSAGRILFPLAVILTIASVERGDEPSTSSDVRSGPGEDREAQPKH